MKGAGIACIAAALLLAGCTASDRQSIGRNVTGQPCFGANYESYDCHADGTPVTVAEHAEAKARTVAECQRLYAMFGDRALTPMQTEAVRVRYNSLSCTSHWSPQ